MGNSIDGKVCYSAVWSADQQEEISVTMKKIFHSADIEYIIRSGLATEENLAEIYHNFNKFPNKYLLVDMDFAGNSYSSIWYVYIKSTKISFDRWQPATLDVGQMCNNFDNHWAQWDKAIVNFCELLELPIPEGKPQYQAFMSSSY